MLYVAIWYVSIRPVVVRVKEELQFFLLLRSGWTCRVVRVLPHTKSANTACKKRPRRWTGKVRNMSS